MLDMKCPICNEDGNNLKVFADFEYIYFTEQCSNGHRFGGKRRGTEQELGEARFLMYYERAIFLKRIEAEKGGLRQ